MIARVADAGFIIALNSGRADEEHWARGEIKKWKAPFITCEGALIEAAHFVGPVIIAEAIQMGILQIAFDLEQQILPVTALLKKYRDQPMDFTDACIVRMTELFPDCLVFSLDRDFEVYRRFGNKPIPVVYPPWKS